jgi:single-strand DNA-binding protein
MPDGLNEATFIGSLSTDPEMRYTADGNAMTTFTLAVNQSFVGDDGERRESRSSFRVVAWNNLAETIGQQLQKGARVYVDGRIATRTWDSQDGQRHYQTEIIANQVVTLEQGPSEPLLPDEELLDVPAGVNSVLIIGNLGRDPEMRYTASGAAVTNFSVAVSRTIPSRGERREETEWFRVVTWNRTAETVGQYLQKGQKVCVKGRLATRSWDDAQGQKHWITELVASRVLFLDRPQGARYPDGGGDIDPDDLPFA